MPVRIEAMERKIERIEAVLVNLSLISCYAPALLDLIIHVETSDDLELLTVNCVDMSLAPCEESKLILAAWGYAFRKVPVIEFEDGLLGLEHNCRFVRLQASHFSLYLTSSFLLRFALLKSLHMGVSVQPG